MFLFFNFQRTTKRLLLLLPIAFLLSKNVFDIIPYAKASSRDLLLSAANSKGVTLTAAFIKAVFLNVHLQSTAIQNFLSLNIKIVMFISLQPKNNAYEKTMYTSHYFKPDHLATFGRHACP